jgi:large subunit ribosomal protein L5
MLQLKEKYRSEVLPKLKSELGVKNVLRLPRLKKVVLNMGIGNARRDHAKELAEDLARIAGQRPVVTRARKSISNFKLREGMSVGAKVTLRGDRMYDFLDRLIHVALPRIRDFRGISPRSFDGRGSYTLGVKEQAIFPEIDPNAVTTPQGLDITIVTTGRTDAEARLLLKLLGMPFAAK